MRATGWVFGVLLVGCDGGEVDSDLAAEQAYIGLHEAVGRALKLGLKGFNEASSANLDPQTEAGGRSGTMVVGGQADQGSSDNKGLRLEVALTDYADLAASDESDVAIPEIAYDTAASAPAAVDLQLRDIPEGTFSGSLVGTFALSGDLFGEVTLDLALDGALTADNTIPGGVSRVEGQTQVIGTATNDDGGVYEVDVQL